MSKASDFSQRLKTLLERTAEYLKSPQECIKEEYTGNGMYVSVKPVPEGITKLLARLAEYIPDLKIADPSDLHVTILYDKTAGPEMKKKALELLHMRLKMPPVMTGLQLKTIIGHDDKPYLILELEPHTLQHFHVKWINAGFTHSFPDFLPHMTLEKESSISEETHQYHINNFNMSMLRTPLLMQFGTEIINDIKDD